jgi:hypothetical protein
MSSGWFDWKVVNVTGIFLFLNGTTSIGIYVWQLT